MLHLWPRSLHIGLFPGHIWVQNKRISIEHPFSYDPLKIEQQILEVLAELLHAHKDQIDPKSRVTFSVSDRFAAIALLPWRVELFRTEEVNNFAQICFEKQHQVIDADWLMHAEFSRYGSNGLAYAFRQTWLNQLHELCSQNQLILQKIHPMTAVAYFANKQKIKSGKQLIVLSEASRASSLLFDGRQCIALDVEPISQVPESSIVRLVKRACALHENIRQMTSWSVSTDSEKRSWPLIGEEFPDMTIQNVNRQFRMIPNK